MKISYWKDGKLITVKVNDLEIFLIINNINEYYLDGIYYIVI